MTESTRKKMSEMVSEFAGDFIRLGEDNRKRNINLQLACSAWNLANLSKPQRKKAFRMYMDDFRKLNPEADFAAVEHNLKQLILEKLARFPLELATIISAEYKEGDDENRISIVSVPKGTLPRAGTFPWN